MKLSHGPHLGHVTDSLAKVWFAIDEPLLTTSPTQIVVDVWEESKKQEDSEKHIASPVSDAVENRCWGVVLDQLLPDTAYLYDIKIHQGGVKESLLKDSLNYYSVQVDPAGDEENPTFTTRPSNWYGKVEKYGFAFWSCSDTANNGDLFWNMAKQALIDLNADKVDFVIACGDQVYMDEGTNAIDLSSYERGGVGDQNPLNSSTLLEQAREQYYRQWGNQYTNIVFSRFPSYMIWDDHELNDGWGSTDFRRNSRKSEFQAFATSYVEFQHFRNPTISGSIPYKSDDFSTDKYPPFHYCFLAGGSGFIVLDLRGHRDSTRSENPVLGASQFEEITSWVTIHKADIDSLFVVSSVPFVHLRHAFPGAVLEPNFGDQWLITGKQRKELAMILDYLFDLVKTDGIRVTVLAGDAHKSFKTKFTSPEYAGIEIEQYVCSPVSHSPQSMGLVQSSLKEGEVEFTTDGYIRDQNSDEWINEYETRVDDIPNVETRKRFLATGVNFSDGSSIIQQQNIAIVTVTRRVQGEPPEVEPEYITLRN